MNDERVTRFGAVDKERTGLRIWPLTALHAGRVKTARVYGRSDHMIARLYMQHWRMRARKRVVEFRRRKLMGFRESRGRQRQRQEQFHTHPPVWTSIPKRLPANVIDTARSLSLIVRPVMRPCAKPERIVRYSLSFRHTHS